MAEEKSTREHALRGRYTDKVRAVEYSTAVKDGDKPKDDSNNPYYIERYKDEREPDSSEGSSASSSWEYSSYDYNVRNISSAGTAAAVIDLPGNESLYSPTGFNLSAGGRAYYKAVAKKPLNSISFSTATYMNTATMDSSTEDRGRYAATMMKYIESVGGVDKDTNGVFTMINPNDFNRMVGVETHNGLYVRSDLAYYLKELQRRVLPLLTNKTNKIQLNSLYRPPGWEYDAFFKAGTFSPWNGHLIGMAADISAVGINRAIIADIAHQMGFGGIAIGKNFVHVDLLKKVCWSYPGVPKYESPSVPGKSVYK